jgi:hypothetical protein
MAVCSDIHTKHIHCMQNVKFFNFKPVDASANQQTLKG